jgi:hypothetical protein
MKNLCWGEVADGRLVLRDGKTGKPLRPGTPFDALVMSRRNIDVRVLDLPRISSAHAAAVIRHRIRSIYPGSPEETVVDFRLFRHNRARRAVVWIGRTDVVSLYRAAAGARPLLVTSALVSGIVPRRGRCRVELRHDGWKEMLEFEDGLLQSSQTGNGRHRADPAPVRIAVCVPPLTAAPGNAEPVMPVSLLAARLGRVQGAFDPHEDRARGFAPVRLGALAAAALVLALMVFFKVVQRAEHRAVELHAVSAALQAGSRSRDTARMEMSKKEAELARLNRSAPRDMYALFSELASVAEGGIRIRSIVVSGDTFRFEAVGKNPLQLVERLHGRGKVSEIRLSQVVADPAVPTESFSISGVFHGR